VGPGIILAQRRKSLYETRWLLDLAKGSLGSMGVQAGNYCLQSLAPKPTSRPALSNLIHALRSPTSFGDAVAVDCHSGAKTIQWLVIWASFGRQILRQ